MILRVYFSYAARDVILSAEIGMFALITLLLKGEYYYFRDNIYVSHCHSVGISQPIIHLYIYFYTYVQYTTQRVNIKEMLKFQKINDHG